MHLKIHFFWKNYAFYLKWIHFSGLKAICTTMRIICTKIVGFIPCKFWYKSRLQPNLSLFEISWIFYSFSRNYRKEFLLDFDGQLLGIERSIGQVRVTQRVEDHLCGLGADRIICQVAGWEATRVGSLNIKPSISSFCSNPIFVDFKIVHAEWQDFDSSEPSRNQVLDSRKSRSFSIFF